MINLNEVVQYLKRNYPNLKAEIVTAAKNGGECTGISVTFRENASAIYYPNSYETDCDKVINEILTMIGKSVEHVRLMKFIFLRHLMK